MFDISSIICLRDFWFQYFNLPLLFTFKNMLIKKNINFFIQFNVVFLIYLSLFPHSAWIGLGIYMVKDMSKKVCEIIWN